MTQSERSECDCHSNVGEVAGNESTPDFGVRVSSTAGWHVETNEILELEVLGLATVATIKR